MTYEEAEKELVGIVERLERGIEASAITVTRAGAHPPSRADLGVDAAR